MLPEHRLRTESYYNPSPSCSLGAYSGRPGFPKLALGGGQVLGIGGGGGRGSADEAGHAPRPLGCGAEDGEARLTVTDSLPGVASRTLCAPSQEPHSQWDVY